MTITLEDAKARARRLRGYLAGQDIKISHSQSLEAVAHEDGHRDWNTFSALSQRRTDAAESACPYTVGMRLAGLYMNSPFTGFIRGVEMAGKGALWHLSLQFDGPVDITMGERLRMARQRVKLLVDGQGRSVNLLGKTDGRARVAPE